VESFPLITNVREKYFLLLKLNGKTMIRIQNIMVLLFLLITMAACSNNDPEPLAGT
jgi:hypothetical protein